MQCNMDMNWTIFTRTPICLAQWRSFSILHGHFIYVQRLLFFVMVFRFRFRFTREHIAASEFLGR